MIIQWHLTNSCNLRCSHCYQEDFGAADEFQLSQIRSVFSELEDFRSKRGANFGMDLTFTGGEPLLYGHLSDVVQMSCEANYVNSYAILTNGMLLTDDHLSLFKMHKPRYIQVSLDGTKVTHEQIRGKGTFDPAVDAIKRLVSAGIYTSVSFTANALNYTEFGKVAGIVRKLGVQHLWADRSIPSAGEAALQTLGPSETKVLIRGLRNAVGMNALIPTSRTRITTGRALQFLAIPFGPVYRCRAGENLLAILPGGDVLPCRRMGVKVGNLFEQGLNEILENPFLESLRNGAGAASGCETCSKAAQCGGGLKCLSFAVHGTPFVRDPGCWLKT